MVATIRFEEQIEIPLDIRSLADFRRWAASEGFPERGRIDFLSGSIEVDMSPEDLFCHGTLKGEIYATLHHRVKRGQLGHLFVDRTRVSCPEAELSVEPDVVFVSTQSRADGRIRLVPKAGGGSGRYAEIQGPPDLIVEIVSDASVAKDTHRLPQAYARAGVPEFWLADARGQELTYRIHHLTPAGYQPAPVDEQGFQHSTIFNCGFRLDGQRNEQGEWTFDLRAKQSS